MKIILTMLFIGFLSVQAHAELFTLYDIRNESERDLLQFHVENEQGTAFSEALTPDRFEYELNYIRLLGSFSKKTSDELLAYFQTHMPTELELAMQSSGNMHNPAIQPLRKNFVKAFQTTIMYQTIAEEMLKHNYQIERVEFEKFMINTEERMVDYLPDIWLILKEVE